GREHVPRRIELHHGVALLVDDPKIGAIKGDPAWVCAQAKGTDDISRRIKGHDVVAVADPDRGAIKGDRNGTRAHAKSADDIARRIQLRNAADAAVAVGDPEM